MRQLGEKRCDLRCRSATPWDPVLACHPGRCEMQGRSTPTRIRRVRYSCEPHVHSVRAPADLLRRDDKYEQGRGKRNPEKITTILSRKLEK